MVIRLLLSLGRLELQSDGLATYPEGNPRLQLPLGRARQILRGGC